MLPSPVSFTLAVDSGDLSTNSPSTESLSSDPLVGEEKIKRPSNSFFCFRKDFIAKHTGQKVDGKSWSKQAAEVWWEMSSEERKPWQAKAASEKVKHAKEHPGYKFAPKAAGRRQRHPKPTQRPYSGRKCHSHSRQTSPMSDTSEGQRQQQGMCRTSSTGSSVSHPQITSEDMEMIFGAAQDIFDSNVVLEYPTHDADFAMPVWTPPQSHETDNIDWFSVPELMSPSASSVADSLVSVPLITI